MFRTSVHGIEIYKIKKINTNLSSFVLAVAGCRRLKFISPADNRRLEGHVIWNRSIGIHGSCHHFCAMERECVSVNINPVLNDTVVCELNDADALQNPGDLKVTPGWNYRATEVRNTFIS